MGYHSFPSAKNYLEIVKLIRELTNFQGSKVQYPLGLSSKEIYFFGYFDR
jgi:hypothetical protein